MKSRARYTKNIKIYNKTHDSFKILKDKDFFTFFSDNSKFNNSVIELLIRVTKEFNPHDNFLKEEFEEFVNDYIDIIEIYYDQDIPYLFSKELTNKLYNIYESGHFYDFRGEVLEYLMVYLVKSNENKIYHEPRFYHKRKRLFKKSFPGSNCLIDVVEVNKRTKDINLTECKANLDNNIKKLGGKKKSFFNKLTFMKKLSTELGKYKNHNGEKIEVNKNLATVIDPKLNLPEGFEDFIFINLLDFFIKKRVAS